MRPMDVMFYLIMTLYSTDPTAAYTCVCQCNSTDIFQEKMNKLFNGLKYVRIYIH